MWKDLDGFAKTIIILVIVGILWFTLPGLFDIDNIFYFIYKFILIILPLFGTAILGFIAFRMWLHYVQQDFISGIEFVLLEVVPPREVLRSPKAMELFLSNALYHWSMKGGREEYWQGAVWFWFSLEIVSIDGQVHFYIRTPSRIKGLIETQMYAQYPQAQVKVVEDYTLAVDDVSPEGAWKAWGCEFKLTKHQAFPIKTYVDFGLDKDPKEEYKVDPISPIIEFFGSLEKGEQAWMQVVVTPSKKMYPDQPNLTFAIKASPWGKHDWIQESKDEILRFAAIYTNIRAWDKDVQHRGVEVRIPRYLEKTVEGMSAKTSKLGFETGVRVMYVAKREHFNISNRRNIRLILRQFAKPDSNEFYRWNSTQADAYSGYFPLPPRKIDKLAGRMLNEYRERSFFHLPLRHHLFNTHTIPWPLSGMVLAYKHPPTFVLNTEEIATLWHFPGQILKTPTLERIESKEASPPPNLPV